MANAFLEKVRAEREAEQREEERLREEEKAADRLAKRQDRLELIRAAGERVTEVVRHRRANGIPPPGRRRRRETKAPTGAAAPELTDVDAGDLPRFELRADE
jgi:hypothetical protein